MEEESPVDPEEANHHAVKCIQRGPGITGRPGTRER